MLLRLMLYYELSVELHLALSYSKNNGLLVNQILAIGTQQTTQTVCSGTSASFNVLATGTGLSYQWRKGTTNLTDGGTISGAATATNYKSTGERLLITMIITGTAPCTPLTSNNATLVINQAVSITQPQQPKLYVQEVQPLSVNATGQA
jgi:hypothetical protein